MTKLYVYPYNTHSESAKLLADRLGALRIRLQNSTYEHKPSNLVINWGNTSCPHPCLNPPDKLHNTVNKIRFFKMMTQKGLSHALPEYWTDRADIPLCEFPILCRTRVEGMDGAGIVVAEKWHETVEAPLYTKLYKNCKEYRVTVFKGYGVTDIQRKQVRNGVSDADPYIKTYGNGWGFVRVPNQHLFTDIKAFAEKILEATGLDFAGLDIIWDMDSGKFMVLEANSAMGLEGDALERFASAVEWYVGQCEESREKDRMVPVAIGIDGWLDSAPADVDGNINWSDIVSKMMQRILQKDS